MTNLPSKATRTIAAVAFALIVSPGLVNLQAHGPDVHDYYKPKPYPLTKCLVSDEALDARGKPYVFNYRRQQIKLCCKACHKTFKKEPARYVGKLGHGH